MISDHEPRSHERSHQFLAVTVSILPEVIGPQKPLCRGVRNHGKNEWSWGTHVDVSTSVDSIDTRIDDRVLHGKMDDDTGEANTCDQDESEALEPGENSDRAETLLKRTLGRIYCPV